jgi:hypothetical protein
MALSLSPPRVRAIKTLQKLRDHRPANSLEYAAADHAIDLVLNDTRPADNFLLVNVLKDARSVVLRQRRRANGRVVDLDALDNLAGDAADSPSAVLSCSPEATLTWSEGYRKLKAWGDQQPVRTARCLEDWRLGYTGTESARRQGLSRRTLTTERKVIRDAAVVLLVEAA